MNFRLFSFKNSLKFEFMCITLQIKLSFESFIIKQMRINVDTDKKKETVTALCVRSRQNRQDVRYCTTMIMFVLCILLF